MSKYSGLIRAAFEHFWCVQAKCSETWVTVAMGRCPLTYPIKCIDKWNACFTNTAVLFSSIQFYSPVKCKCKVLMIWKPLLADQKSNKDLALPTRDTLLHASQHITQSHCEFNDKRSLPEPRSPVWVDHLTLPILGLVCYTCFPIPQSLSQPHSPRHFNETYNKGPLRRSMIE